MDGRRTRKLGNALRPPNAEFALRDPTAGIDVLRTSRNTGLNASIGLGSGPYSEGEESARQPQISLWSPQSAPIYVQQKVGVNWAALRVVSEFEFPVSSWRLSEAGLQSRTTVRNGSVSEALHLCRPS